MIAQQDGSRLAMIGTQERAAAQPNEQDALRQELAASRSISASLEKHQGKLEEELTLLRESNKRLQWQLNEAEGLVRSTSEAGAGSDTAQEDLSALRDEVKSLLQAFKAELEVMRRQAATQSSAPAASPANGSTITAASEAVSPETEQAQLRAKLERQEMENSNHRLLQSLLCDHIRKLDPSRA